MKNSSTFRRRENQWQNKKSTPWLDSHLAKGQCEEREEEELTCAGIVIDPDEASMANAHEGARRVDAHSVLPAVVLPLGTLVNICKGSREEEGNRSQARRRIEKLKKKKNSFLSISELSVSGIPSQLTLGASEEKYIQMWVTLQHRDDFLCCRDCIIIHFILNRQRVNNPCT